MFSSDDSDDLDQDGEELMLSNFSDSENARLIAQPSLPTLTVRTAAEAQEIDDKTEAEVSHNNGFGNSSSSESSRLSRGLTLNNISIMMKNDSRKSTPYVWLLASFSAVGGFLFGYDTGVVSGAMLLLRDEFSLSSFWQEVIVSVTIGAAFLAALAGGPLNDMFGRKIVTILASFVFTVGALVLGAASNISMLVAGRAILGVGIGFASMTVPVYIAECAPAHVRGRMVTVNTLFITGGQCVASVIDGGFSYVRPDGWRYMLGLAALPSLVQLCGFLFLPESPRWLLRKERDAEARSVLVKLRGTQEVDSEIAEIKEMLGAETAGQGRATLVRMLSTPPVRRALVVGCGLQLFQQFGGINTVMYYSATIIRMSGVSDEHTAIWLAAVTAAVNFLFTLVGVWLVEKIGRKRLLMGSMIGVIFSLAVMAVAFQLAAYNSPAISEFDHGHLNTSCSSYRWCESCIEDTHCGFCYSDTSGSINGTCVSTHPSRNAHADFGRCENTTLPTGQVWAYDYCPTPFSWLAVMGLVLYLMFFAPGMGPMPWTINSEIYPLWARSTGNSLSAATNWVANLLVSMTFLTLTETLTKYGTYWLFVCMSILGLAFFAKCLPETRGKRLEDVEELFAQPWSSCMSLRPAQYTSLDSQTRS
ncbi:proton myo-inositol cotransporter [Aplysia californica]|uniref:Proton myo-inositol cotransporter n=1 Tax=Aplysia californica TaxID=6500 RepID=A0ABM0KA90_APLCA|nr:proton myo-inositol cotransporter [Aplysia californica]